MKKEFVKAMKILRYSISVKMNILCAILFSVVGLFTDVMQCIGMQSYGSDGNLIGEIGLGAFLFLCAGMFPAQMLISLDVCNLTQTSPYKRKYQTSMPSIFNGGFLALCYTILVVERVIVWSITKNAEVFNNLLVIGISAAVVILYCMFVYKFFVLSIIILYMLMFTGGIVIGIVSRVVDGIALPLSTSPVLAVILSYVLILIATIAHYVMTRLLYKYPLSKYAFGAALRRNSA